MGIAKVVIYLLAAASWIALTCSNSSSSSSSLTQEQVEAIQCILRDMMIEDTENGTDFNLMGGCVRLMFHDCVGGIVDGCVDLTNPSNNHLGIYITRLLDARTENMWNISKADLFILCGYTAIELAANNSQYRDILLPIVTANLTFKQGRVDRDGICPRRRFPDFSINPVNFLTKNRTNNKNFPGLNPRQAVALMGAHTLGRTHIQSSGYMNSWVQNHTQLDNRYFQLLSDNTLDWHQINVTFGGVTKVQWVRGPNNDGVMLHTDVGNWYQLRLNRLGFATCGYPGTGDEPRLVECEPTDKQQYVREFANSVTDFVGAFVEAVIIMTQTGCSNLTIPT